MFSDHINGADLNAGCTHPTNYAASVTSFAVARANSNAFN